MNYKGFEIDTSYIVYPYITVFYCGDDIIFDDVESAKKFIDEICETA